MWLDSEYSQNEVFELFSFYVNLYAYNDTSNGIYTVTFDYNDGITESTTKQVVYHQVYGELPAPPEREGYTFMGWNGKNIFDILNISINSLDGKVIGNTLYMDKSYIEGNVANRLYVHLIFEDDTQLNPSMNNISTIGLSTATFNVDKTLKQIMIHLNTNKIDSRAYINASMIKINKSYTLSYNVEMLDFSNAKATISYIQLEEGDTATPYEPYYITNTTQVVQDKDHTLKAIWKENS